MLVLEVLVLALLQLTLMAVFGQANGNGVTVATRTGVYGYATDFSPVSTVIGGYFSSSGGLANYGVISPLTTNTNGFGTGTPVSRVDINGDIALREGTAFTVVTGANALLLAGEYSHYRLYRSSRFI
jgi:hypothetical protein